MLGSGGDSIMYNITIVVFRVSVDIGGQGGLGRTEEEMDLQVRM
jgi:hypothetical protein